MIDQSIAIDDFCTLLADEGLIPASLEALQTILNEIKPHALTFRANTPELVQLANQHSLTFQALPADRQAFFASVLSMLIFFCTPLQEET